MLDAIKAIINKEGDITLQDIVDIIKVILDEVFGFIKDTEGYNA